MGAVKNHYHDEICRQAALADLEVLDSDGRCDHCDEPFEDESPNIEAFEVLDLLLCETCADEALADHGQFGVGT